ncbi:hypothetical protein SLU01_10180 [Sporosarcina luteola]|uniref:Uncharacterized protein n=1 Tax=Sporosarcina luteola TaxID=582850 RepID=A0A511Z5I4_9BACL|nr:hypothetical protein [Sporosarcina luteola]GEN82706.1 hypothetical protein SLU01_10180 [Sporosarcina luteola]
MKVDLPVKLAFPLYFSIIFIFSSGINSLFDTLGNWKYIIWFLIILMIMWGLQKSKLTEKKVPIWIGAFIIIAGFVIGIIFDTLILN